MRAPHQPYDRAGSHLLQGCMRRQNSLKTKRVFPLDAHFFLINWRNQFVGLCIYSNRSRADRTKQNRRSRAPLVEFPINFDLGHCAAQRDARRHNNARRAPPPRQIARGFLCSSGKRGRSRDAHRGPQGEPPAAAAALEQDGLEPRQNKNWAATPGIAAAARPAPAALMYRMRYISETEVQL